MSNQSAPSVVVIDDDDMIRDLIAMFLTEQGYNVQVANSAQTGIELVRTTLPKVVLCDIEMGGGGGRKVVAALKADPSTRNIPIGMMSGSLEADSFAAGDAFISKPFSEADIVATVKRLISGPNRPPQTNSRM